MYHMNLIGETFDEDDLVKNINFSLSFSSDTGVGVSVVCVSRFLKLFGDSEFDFMKNFCCWLDFY